MEEFMIIEVGSTNTKAYIYKNSKIQDLGFKTIEFKKNYNIEKKIADNDKKMLFEFIKKFDEKNIFVFGTSIFRNLDEEQKHDWLREFKDETGLDFIIVTSDMENELTVYGAISDISYDGKIAVMIGGGGSTELSIMEKGISIEKLNLPFGAIDVTEMFPDIKEDKAYTEYNSMVNKIKDMITLPKNHADIMILAGGDYIYFYEEMGYHIDQNKFYENELQPYCLDIDSMDKFDKDFFYETSLDQICKRTKEDGWWRGARGMRLCVKALTDILEVKYIIPTRISMVYGIVSKLKNGEFFC